MLKSVRKSNLIQLLMLFIHFQYICRCIHRVLPQHFTLAQIWLTDPIGLPNIKDVKGECVAHFVNQPHFIECQLVLTIHRSLVTRLSVRRNTKLNFSTQNEHFYRWASGNDVQENRIIYLHLLTSNDDVSNEQLYYPTNFH